MKQSIQLRLGQHLTMTPQLQQAIRLLQLSTVELKQEIQDALDSNLMLELEDDKPSDLPELAANPMEQETKAAAEQSNSAERELEGATDNIPDELPVDSEWEDQYDLSHTPVSSAASEDFDFLSQQSHTDSLKDHLLWQLNLTPISDSDRAIALAIIDGVDDAGYLRLSLEDLVDSLDDEDAEADQVLSVLHLVQRFDPPGVAARSPQECLLLQLEQLPESRQPLKSQAVSLIRDYFDLLVSADEAKLCRALKLDSDEIRAVIGLIRALNPRPGAAISPSNATYVEPDVFVHKKNQRWVVSLNKDNSPRLRINTEYSNMIRRADSSQDNQTMKDHLQEARWFIKSLESRNDTLLRVAAKIVDYQQDFFEYGEEAMKPLVLREIAETLEMHESTISRVTTQKYMMTPRGILEFKYFFSSQLGTDNGESTSAIAIRAMIKKLIAAEKPGKPLSDSKLADLLTEMGIQVARRTVAKYREAMAIPPSNERKRLV